MDVNFLVNQLQSSLYPTIFKLIEQQLSRQASDSSKEGTSEIDPYNQVSGEASPVLNGSASYGARSAGQSTGFNFSELVSKAAEKYNLDPDLIQAVMKAESNFNPDVVSKAGAMGLMQLMPGTARSLGVKDAFDPEENINGGSLYLNKMMNRYGGSIEKTLAAYNAGPGAVDKYGGIPPYRETQVYVDRVMKLYQNYNEGT